MVLAICVAAVVTQIPLAVWERWAPWLFVTALVLLILVLIPHVGKGVNGARRWLPLGVMNFQPSEVGCWPSPCMPPTTWCARWM